MEATKSSMSDVLHLGILALPLVYCLIRALDGHACWAELVPCDILRHDLANVNIDDAVQP